LKRMADEKIRGVVAVVGSGIAGLSCAYLLSQNQDYEVYLFESEEHLGMDAHSVDVPLSLTSHSGPTARVDAPPRAFSKEFYPNLWNLYSHANVPIEKFDWSFSCTVEDSPQAYFHSGDSAPIFSRLWQFVSWNNVRCLYDAVKFYIQIRWYAQSPEHTAQLNRVTCREFLKTYSDEFTRNWFLPIMSMICTCSYEAVLQYPMDIVLDYFMKNGTYNQYRSRNGSLQVVKILSQHVKKVYLNSPVEEIFHASAATGGSPKLTAVIDRKERKEFTFDHIVVASQAVTSVKLIKDLLPAEADALEAIGYEYSDVVIHQDANLMPVSRADWAPMNFILSKNRDKVMFTMLLDVEGRAEPVYQTWNPVTDVDPRLLYKTTTMLRPVVTLKSVDAIQDLDKLQGRGGIWYCGAYAMHAIPLQENGVRSAVRVATALGVQPLW
jgi:predicted NAD/FAD-binding protein